MKEFFADTYYWIASLNPDDGDHEKAIGSPLDGILVFEQRPDKDWSFTDCISFVVMRERGITDALSGDHHFEQAGFNALLK